MNKRINTKMFEIFYMLVSYLFAVLYLVYLIYFRIRYSQGIAVGNKTALVHIRLFDNFEASFAVTFWFMIICVLIYAVSALVRKFKQKKSIALCGIVWAFVPLATVLVCQGTALIGAIAAAVLSVLYIVLITLLLIAFLKPKEK